MMDSYQNQIKLTSDALNANGYAEEANTIRMETFAVKQEQLKATMVGMWDNIIDTDVVKGGMDVLQGLLDMLGGVPAQIITSIASVLVLKATIDAFKTSSIGKSLRTTVKDIKRTVGAFKTLSEVIKDSGMELFKFGKEGKKNAEGLIKKTGASKKATKSALGLTSAIKGIGVGLAITGAIALITHLAQAQQKAIDKANEMRDAYNQFTTQNSSNITQLQSFEDEFNTLSKGVDDYGNNLSLTTEEHNRYKEIIEQILQISPQLSEGYSIENGHIVDKNELLEKTNLYITMRQVYY